VFDPGYVRPRYYGDIPDIEGLEERLARLEKRVGGYKNELDRLKGSATWREIDTPTAPFGDFHQLFMGTDGELYKQDSDGTLTSVSRNVTRVYRTGSKSINAGASWTVEWDNEERDDSGWFDAGSNTRITVGADGLYRVTCNAGGAAGIAELSIKVNGVEVINTALDRSDGAQGANSVILSLSADDYIEFTIKNNHGSVAQSVDVGINTCFACVEGVL